MPLKPRDGLSAVERNLSEWRDDQKLVHHKLDKLEEGVEALLEWKDEFSTSLSLWRIEQAKEITALKVKSATHGALGGFLIASLFEIVKAKFLT